MAQAKQVRLGQVWTAKVSGRTVHVEILRELPAPRSGGRARFEWKNLSTNRISQGTAGRLKTMISSGVQPAPARQLHEAELSMWNPRQASSSPLPSLRGRPRALPAYNPPRTLPAFAPFARNGQGGVDPTTRNDLSRAERADLVTLPAQVQGTNCSNCSYVTVQPTPVAQHWCGHPEVNLPITPRMCCALWDAPGTVRAWS